MTFLSRKSARYSRRGIVLRPGRRLGEHLSDYTTNLSDILTRNGGFALDRTLCFLRSSSDFAQLFKIPNIQPRALSLSFRTKRIFERFRLDDVCPLIMPASVFITSTTMTSATHFPQIRVGSIVEQSHWKFVAPKEDGVGVMLFR